MQEEKVSDSAWFITLTYAPENVPISKMGLMTLVKKDVQDWMKRLRERHKERGCDKSIKYYAAGEYGSAYNRPHYHVIIFNAHPADIEQAWGLGHIHYGKVEGASIGYTLKYLHKQHKAGSNENDDRQCEFALMSKGLGKVTCQTKE